MYVKACNVGVAHTAAAHVRFIGNDERRRYIVDRHARALVVVAYGGNDCRRLGSVHAHFVKNTESHHRAALGVIHAVHKVSYIVHIRRNAGKLDLACVLSQRFKNVCAACAGNAHMGKAVLRVAESGQRFVRLLYICFYIFAVLYVLVCYHNCPLYYLFVSLNSDFTP